MTAGPHQTCSAELVATAAPGIELCYQTFGDPGGEPLLLIMGLGGPMIWWDDPFCELLAARGFYVIRFDNRDCGRSTLLEGRVTLAHLTRAYAGLGGRPAYSIPDLAADALGLLDHLGIDSAHVVGMSMGGMVAQTIAISRPDRVRSLTSIMSTTGRRSVGWQHPALFSILLTRVNDREGYLAAGQRLWGLIGSPDYPTPVSELRARGLATWERGVCRPGTARQMLAILTQPDRTEQLRRLTTPTLVIHGLADKMVHVSGGRETARLVRGSELLLVPGMGHDLPAPLWPAFVAAIERTARRGAQAHSAAGS
ncbi:alpha/beta fold hydrolase [Nocardioides insulae]|uniref:alpha/beta fold hydrolase n=1 Tax=Nocardioides insulae TaxID=394734 RepID=UPI00041A481E|nr:alpha/beta hydrolase [Nocardioides insulae]